ncbi:hypothetical protein TGME49_257670 [Toxoplasma gondii ME49]|uniref:Uncharacterized protein n=2 Tax=Toxoplasma gondii TaxID=5811 RepID=A0A125YHK0_TOXGV|nr:hypothetical protein TGME49_257670 [Toxoplasma gondii ME49]EPT29281.1 hypothetical protein TGME49_257670 [Toxoplasma gondii ME49]ESS28576.1 hypothetical protein TGVEG_257670 [Toxoplasma gondii VEG]|eukprot:XP_018636982.1 hypothetical protein TGME49_257670 [Toxoplasma gondii ME49]
MVPDLPRVLRVDRGERGRGPRSKMEVEEDATLRDFQPWSSGGADLCSLLLRGDPLRQAKQQVASMRESVAVVEDLLQQVSGFHQLLLAELKTKSRDIRAFVAALTHRGLQLPVATKRPGLPTPPPLRRLRRRLLSKQKAETRGFDLAAKAGIAEEKNACSEGGKKEKAKEKKEGKAAEEREEGREEEEEERTEEKDAEGDEEDDVERGRGENGEEEGDAAGERKGKEEDREKEGDAEGKGEARSDGERKERRGELRRRGGNAGERCGDKATSLKEEENEKRKESLSFGFEASPKTPQHRKKERSRQCERSTSPFSVSAPFAGTALRNATPGYKDETPCRSLLFLSSHSSSPHSPSSPSRPLSLPSSCSSPPQSSSLLPCASSAVQNISPSLRSDDSACWHPHAVCTASSLGAEREESRDASGEGGETSLLQERQRERQAQRKRRGDAGGAQRTVRTLPAAPASLAITDVSPGAATEAERLRRRHRRRMSPLASPSNSVEGVKELKREKESTALWRQHPSLALPSRETDSPSGSVVHMGERESKTRGEEADTCKALEGSSPSESLAPSRSMSASSCASGASPFSATETSSLLVPSPSTRSHKRKRTPQASALTSSSLSPSCDAEEKEKTNDRGTVKSRRVLPPSTLSSPSSLSSSLSSSSSASSVSFSSTSVSETASRPDRAVASDALDGGVAAEKLCESGDVSRSSQQEGTMGPCPFSDAGARESSSTLSHSAPSASSSLSSFALIHATSSRRKSTRGGRLQRPSLQCGSGGESCLSASAEETGISADAPWEPASEGGRGQPAAWTELPPAASQSVKTRKTGRSSARRSKTGDSGCAEGAGEGETSDGLLGTRGGGSREEEKARKEAMETEASGDRERLATEATAKGRRRENGETENFCCSASASSKAERGRSEKTRREKASRQKERVMSSSSTDSSSEDAPVSRRRLSLCLSCEPGLRKSRNRKTSPHPRAGISPSVSFSPQSLLSSGPPAYASHLSSPSDAASSCASASASVSAPDCGVEARAPASAVSRKGEEKSPQAGSIAEETTPGNRVIQRGGRASCRQRGAERRANSGRPGVQKVSRSSPRGSKGSDGKARKGTADDLVPSKEKRLRLGDEKDPWLPSGGQTPRSRMEPRSSASGSKGPSDALGSKRPSDTLGSKGPSDALGSKGPSDTLGSKGPSDALGSKGPPLGGEGDGPLCRDVLKRETSNSAPGGAEARAHVQSQRSAQSVSPPSSDFSLPSSLSVEPMSASSPQASDSVRGAGTHKQETDKKGKETDGQGTEKGEGASREHGGRHEQKLAREGVCEGRQAERVETLAPCLPDLPSVQLASAGVLDLGQARERSGDRQVEGSHSGLQLSSSDAETLGVSALTDGASSEREKAPCREEARAGRREGEEEQTTGEELEEETTKKRKREDTRTSELRPRDQAGEAPPTQRDAAEATRQATRVEQVEAAEEVEEWDMERGSESGRSRRKCAEEETKRHSERETEREKEQTELKEEAGGERGAKGDRGEKGERRGKGNTGEEGERERGEKGERERDNTDRRGDRGKSHGSIGHGRRLEGGEEAAESRRWRREEEERSGGDRRDIFSAQRSQRSFFSFSQRPCPYQPLWAAQQQERRRCFSSRRGSGSGPADRGDSGCTYTSVDRRSWSRADRSREGNWRSSPPRRDEGSRGRGEEKARHREGCATHSAAACRPSYGEDSRRDEGKWWLEQGRPERHESRNFLPSRMYLRREDADSRSSWDRRLPPASFYQSKSLKSRSFSYSLQSSSFSSSSSSFSSSSSSFSGSSSSFSGSSSSFSSSSSSSSFSSSASSSSFSSSATSSSFSSSASSSVTSSSCSSSASFSSSTSTSSSPSLSAVISPHSPGLSARPSASRTPFLESRGLADAAAGAKDSEETRRPRTLSLYASSQSSLSVPSSSSVFSSPISSSTVSSFASASSCLSSSSASSASFSASSRLPSSSSSSASASSLVDSFPAAPEALEPGSSRVAQYLLRLCASGVSKSVSAKESLRAPMAKPPLDPPCDPPGDGRSEEVQRQKLSSTDCFSCEAEKENKEEAKSHSGHLPFSLPSSNFHLCSPFSSSLASAFASSSPSSSFSSTFSSSSSASSTSSSSFSSSVSSYSFSSSPLSSSSSSSSSVSSFRSESKGHRCSPARLAGPALGSLGYERRPSPTKSVSSKAATTSENAREVEEGGRAWGVVTERGDGVPEKSESGEGGWREHARRLEAKTPRLFSDELSFRLREESRPESDRGERTKRFSPDEVETLDVESKTREEKRTEKPEESRGKRGTAVEAHKTSTQVQTREACDEGTAEERTKKKKEEGEEDGREQQAKEEEEEEEEGEVKEDAPGVQREEGKKACPGETLEEAAGEASPWEKQVKPSLTLFGAFRTMTLQVKGMKARRKVSRDTKKKEILEGEKEKDATRQSQSNHPETRTHTVSLSSSDSVCASASSFSRSSTSASSSSSASPPSSSSSSPAFPSCSSSSPSSFLSTPKNEEGERGSERGPDGGEEKETTEAKVAKTEEKKEKAEHGEEKGDGEKDPEEGPRGFAALHKDDRDARARTVGVARIELLGKKEENRMHAEPARGRTTTDRGKREEEPSEKTAKEAETKGDPPVWSPKREGPLSLPRFTGTGETKGKTEETKRCSSFSSSPSHCALLAVEQVARVLEYSASEKYEKEKEAFLGNSPLRQASSVELGRAHIEELPERMAQREAKGDKGTGAECGGVSVQLTESEGEEGQTAEAQREDEESESSVNEAELKNVCLTLKKELEETLECNDAETTRQLLVETHRLLVHQLPVPLMLRILKPTGLGRTVQAVVRHRDASLASLARRIVTVLKGRIALQAQREQE